MLFYLILLTLTFVCPFVAVLILLGLALKYRQFIKQTGLHPRELNLVGRKRKRALQFQLGGLLITGILMVACGGHQQLQWLGLVGSLIVVIWLMVRSLIAVHQEHSAVNIQALKNDADLDADLIQILVEKRGILLNTVVLTIMLINVAMVLNLL